MKTSAVDNRNIVRALTNNPKTTVSNISNNLKGLEWNYHNLLFTEDSMNKVQRLHWKMQITLFCPKKYRDKLRTFWKKFYGLMRQRLTFTKMMEKLKFGERMDVLLIYVSWSVRHNGGNVMVWACMASSAKGSLIFIDDVTHDGSSKMNSEVYRSVLSANLKKDAAKLIRRSFIM